MGLGIYDVGVLGFNNHVVWRCPTRRLLQEYDQSVSGNHLEAGVGTGWYLDHCRFPAPNTWIGLIDLSGSALAKTSSRLSRFAQESHQAHLLEPVPAVTDPFDSVAMCNLLHCLPVEPEQKGLVLPLGALINPGAVVFGATILGDEAAHSALGRVMLRTVNATGCSPTGAIPSKRSSWDWPSTSTSSTSNSSARSRCSAERCGPRTREADPLNVEAM